MSLYVDLSLSGSCLCCSVQAASHSFCHASLLPWTVLTKCEPSLVALHRMFYLSNGKNNSTNKLRVFPLRSMGLSASVCDSLAWLVCSFVAKCAIIQTTMNSPEGELRTDLWLNVIEKYSWWIYLENVTVTEIMSDSPARGLDYKQRKPNNFHLVLISL